MAKAPDTATEPEFELIPTGLGRVWDFERDGAMVGNFLGEREVPTTKVDAGMAFALEFALRSNPDDIVILWKSSELASAFDVDPATGTSLIHPGDLCRINYLGRDQFTGADGKPRQIKRYKVEAAKR